MSELVKVETNLPAVGGMGVNFGNKLFQLKPTTLVINQGQTQAEGAVPGKLRIIETGDQFDELTVVLLMEPDEARSWYIGEKGKLKRIPENLMCFSRDMVKPDPRSKMPQAITCESCKKHAWNNNVTPAMPPECDPYYFCLFVDTETQLPMKMFVTGIHKKPFESAMQQLSRTIRLMQARGENPNLFDISFKISSSKYKNKDGQVNHQLKVDPKSFHKLTAEESEAFGPIYLNYVNRKGDVADDVPEVKANEKIAEAEQTIEGEIVI